MSNENPLGPAKAPQRRYWQTADFWMDGGERIVSSFLFAFVGAIAFGSFDFTNSKAWGGAAIAAALSVVKALWGAQRKDSTTPVSLF